VVSNVVFWLGNSCYFGKLVAEERWLPQVQLYFGKRFNLYLIFCQLSYRVCPCSGCPWLLKFITPFLRKLLENFALFVPNPGKLLDCKQCPPFSHSMVSKWPYAPTGATRRDDGFQSCICNLLFEHYIIFVHRSY